jgi:translocation and assembly module TamB
MNRRRKWSLLLGATLLLLPMGVLFWVLTTEGGLRFAANTVDRIGRLGPVTIQIRGVSGTLLHGAHFEHVEVHHHNVDVIAQDVRGRLRLPLLLARRIDVTDPHVARAEVTVHASQEPPDTPATAPKFFAPTMRLDVHEGTVEHVRLTLINDTTYEITNISGGVTILPREIRIHDAHGLLPALTTRIHAEGRLHARAPIAFDGQAEVDYTPEELPAWRITGHFDGNLDEVPLNVTIEAPFHAQIDGAAHSLTAGWHFDAKAEVRDFDLTPFGGSDVLGVMSGQLDVGVDANGFTARGAVNPPGLASGPLNVDFQGQYQARRLMIRSATAHHPASGAQATVSGEVVLHEGGGQHIAFSGQWSRFRWPLTGTAPAFHSARGRYTLTGDKPWQVSASGELEAGVFPSMPFEARGTLETERFIIAEAKLDALQGQTQLTGEARWAPHQSWQVEGQAHHIDPTTLRADLPGQLDFDFTANGAPFGEDAALTVAVTNLRGKLRNQSMSGHGRVTRNAGATDLLFEGVDLQLGHTQLRLDGSMQPQTRDLRFVINAEDLSLIDPEARGQLSARGRWAGTTQAPLLQLTARGRNFAWLGLKLESLNADLDIDLGAGQRTTGKVVLEKLQTGARDLQRAALTLDGTPTSQRIAMEAVAEPVKVALSATGAIADGLWRGTIGTLTVKDDHDLSLRLEKPTPLMLSTTAASLDPLCLIGEQAHVCSNGQFDDSGWNAHVEATQLPLITLTAGLTTDIAYQGTINIHASAQGTSGMEPTGELRAQLQDAALERTLSKGRIERMALGSGEVNAIATAQALNLTASLDAHQSGSLTAKLRADRTEGPWRESPLTGTLDMTTDGLGLLDIYVADIDRASGRLTAKVNFDGTLGAPTVDGLLQLRDAQIDVFQANLSMRDLTMDARFDTNRLELTGHSMLGGETMNFSGNLHWQEREPYGELNISGQNLLVVDVPEVVARASPDLSFRIDGRRIDVTGTVRLPEVKLEPADLTNAVLASGDEVMVGQPQVDPQMRWTVVSDIRVELGDRVQLDAFGLTGRLGGALNVRGDEFGVTRGQGELSVTEGQYSAFGRRLDITRGRLIFNNQLLSEPGVDLRAQKVFPDVTAGVNVRGTLRAPRMTFYSEPSLPQWQIASLILAGGSLQTVQNSSARNATSAVLVAQGGAMLAQHFGNQIGIQDVSLETNLNNESSLVFGRYLSPRLYISYGISLAEAINTLRLRYTLNNHWTMRMESGGVQSADIDYTILRGGTGPKATKAREPTDSAPSP